MVGINGTKPRIFGFRAHSSLIPTNQYLYVFVLEHLNAQLHTLLLYEGESAEYYVTL